MGQPAHEDQIDSLGRASLVGQSEAVQRIHFGAGSLHFFHQLFRILGRTDDNGKKIPFDVKVGDVVLTSKYGGTEVKYDGKEYKILSASDILAVIK